MFQGTSCVNFTFRASSGTVSSPFTTVNRFVCETDRLRKFWPQLSHMHTHTYQNNNNNTCIHTHPANITIVSVFKLGYLAWFEMCNPLLDLWGMKDWQVIKVKGYHIQTSACLPVSEWCTSAPEYGHHLQMSVERKKQNHMPQWSIMLSLYKESVPTGRYFALWIVPISVSSSLHPLLPLCSFETDHVLLNC